jgi:hypothetical protein
MTQETAIRPQSFDSAAEGDVRDGVTEVRVRGKNHYVPAVRVAGATVIVSGRMVRIASVKDELFLSGDPVSDPQSFIAELQRSDLKADVFMFSQKPPDTKQYDYLKEWDNFAVIPTGDYDAWWNGLPQETRKNVRRARNRGVVIKVAETSDEFVRGVQQIYNESPIRQGKPFYHYGKDFETIRRELSTFAATSEFLGAYVNGELIGFIKLVHIGSLSSIMHIVSKNAHADKRPTNALLAEAVALCNKRGLSYLVYGNYTYGRKGEDSLATFKRHNGFSRLEFPRYYVPLTSKGKIALTLGLHRDLIDTLPSSLLSALLAVRANILQLAVRRRRASGDQ